MKIRKKSNQGITLIALVITIIVLLILAGVSIATLTGDNGILKKANTAKQETTRAAAKEKVEVAVVGSYGRNGKIDCERLKNNLDKVEGIEEVPETITLPITIKVDDYDITIDREGNVTTSLDSNIEEDDDTVTVGKIVTKENKEYVTDNGTAIIPVGFAIVPGCEDISQGLVISDVANDTENKGNQFVWIPVTNIDNFKTIEGYEKSAKQSYMSVCTEPYTTGEYTAEKTEYDAIKSSVEINHGFYIGRYETGKDNDENVVVKKNMPVYNNIQWGKSMTDATEGAVEKARNFVKDTYTVKGKTVNVISTLCYGMQWDATMQFFDDNYITGNCTSSSYVVNSKDAGNHSGSLIDTGSNDDYAIKNIYDMAGNVFEWTMETKDVGNADREGRVIRGGNYYAAFSTFSASGRNSADVGIYGSNDSTGFRIALYLPIEKND